MRNNEIGGLLGISQLKKLDKNNSYKKNFKLFEKSKFFTNFKIEVVTMLSGYIEYKNIKLRKFEKLQTFNRV